MSEYSKTERRIAVLLNKFPGVKEKIKKSYQRINYLFYKKDYSYKTDKELREFSQGGKETFFGYYDKSPVNKTSEFIIYHASDYATSKLPEPKKQILIILANFKTGKILSKFTTKAYNWQQGAKLMWISDFEFIFNDFDKKTGKYISKIVNAKTGKFRKNVPFPVYDIAGKIALSLNFERLSILRPDYGYRNIKVKLRNLPDTQNDGIFKIDINTGKFTLLISLQDLIELEPNINMNNALHKVNHIMFSPAGNKFIFLHRYFKDGIKLDRLILADIDKKNMKVLSDHEMISHCYWLDNTNIISFMRRFETGDKYYIINTETFKIKQIGEEIIDKFGDGHPSVFGNKMIFDTYPNRSRMKELFSYNIEENNLSKLGEFFEPFKYYGETRCDLHPRGSFDGKFLFFDSVHSGLRRLYCMSF